MQEEWLIILIHSLLPGLGKTPGLRAGVTVAPLMEGAQVTLRAPADILGSVSLRGEEDGWFGRAASGALAAVLDAAGWPAPLPDEFFFQVRLAVSSALSHSSAQAKLETPPSLQNGRWDCAILNWTEVASASLSNQDSVVHPDCVWGSPVLPH